MAWRGSAGEVKARTGAARQGRDWPRNGTAGLPSGSGVRTGNVCILLPEGTMPEDDLPEAQPDDDAPTGDDAEALKAEVAKWKAQSRKHESEAKRNRDAAKRLAELEDGTKSEVERAQSALKAAEDRAAAAEMNLARTNVALRKGLTEAQAKRLQGATEEELEQDATELLELLRPPTAEHEEEPDRALPRRPQERLAPGARPTAEPRLTARQIVDKAAELSVI